MNEYCQYCGVVDSWYDKDTRIHRSSIKHRCNSILHQFKDVKKSFYPKSKDSIAVTCDVEVKDANGVPIPSKALDNVDNRKIRIIVQPREQVDFLFRLTNERSNADALIQGVMLGHPQPHFVEQKNPYNFNEKPHRLGKKTYKKNAVIITFLGADIGQYEMPIYFRLQWPDQNKVRTGDVIICRDMVVTVQAGTEEHRFGPSPYKKKTNISLKQFICSKNYRPYETVHKITPKLLKTLLPLGLEEDAINRAYVMEDTKAQLRALAVTVRTALEIGICKENYIKYFQFLLWWEEIIARIKLRRYNMAKVTITRNEHGEYWLDVPGLAEKRPSLLKGDRAYLKPEHLKPDHVFESIIERINEDSVQLGELDDRFHQHHSSETLFSVRFLMSRLPMERMHQAVTTVFLKGHGCRIFPKKLVDPVQVQSIPRFYNSLIEGNTEQRLAVEHIVSRSSGTAPYIVFGPPGTGKTITIVEAIIQIVVKDPRNRVWVCTDSNMAADHIALALLRYNDTLNINNFILRANSMDRDWTILPPALLPPFSNQSPVSSECVSKYRILVTTLLHSAKYFNLQRYKLKISHLFIDEAAQALEPAALVPISGLLAPNGQLVLAGDPKQLGPVCMSRAAKDRGLGNSLLERLYMTYGNLYRGGDANYITTLVRNFRSHPDILDMPNKMFYAGQLQPYAKQDGLSDVKILKELDGEGKAVVFHAVNSREQKQGNAPSYFNERELEMLRRYTNALVTEHGVLPKDIGIIAPYMRQVIKMRHWLKSNNYKDIEIGTVESFQGKEKRAILISTVRANCKLLDYDAKYSLGFLVEDKRFNVALTRAKAKLIVVGNPACLIRDEKWRLFMDFCKDRGSYFGQEHEQLERTAEMLQETAIARFDKSGITMALRRRQEEREKAQNKSSKTIGIDRSLID